MSFTLLLCLVAAAPFACVAFPDTARGASAGFLGLLVAAYTLLFMFPRRRSAARRARALLLARHLTR